MSRPSPNEISSVTRADTSQVVDAVCAVVREILEQTEASAEAVIPVLQAIQDRFGYLPQAALEEAARLLGVSLSRLWGVATFYDQFRLEPAGRHTIQVCTGTACHVAGADRLVEELRRLLRIPAGQRTDPERMFTLETVACLGCCTLAPVIRIDGKVYGHVSAEKLPSILHDFLNGARAGLDLSEACALTEHSHDHEAEIRIGLGSCCMAKGSGELFRAFQNAARELGVKVRIRRVGCVGMCHRTPLVEVVRPGHESVFYSQIKPDEAGEILRRHFRTGSLLKRVKERFDQWLDELVLDQHGGHTELHRLEQEVVRHYLGPQVHIATEHFGTLDPLDLEEYCRRGGFEALERALESEPEEIIREIESSRLRGRGGAGFPTGRKWRLVHDQTAPEKYVICNGDEGDPGAFMDRMILESFPYRVIEGLAIAALAVGSREGIFYIRHEYPLAVGRIRAAISVLEQRGWLGQRVLGKGPPLRLRVMEGAGAFVCGEETALIASLEGRRGMPRLRPPYPAEQGFRGYPTLVNNVETLAMVPWIMRHGADAFRAYGTESSPGTKVFALAGAVRRGGLIEVPMGTTIRQIVEQIGCGARDGRWKAVQIGGPSGGCVPEWLADTPVDYESLQSIGAIMGSGGLIVLDERTCMVDIARYFLRFTQQQSCGKCTFCRIGTLRMLEILDRLCAGKAGVSDLRRLETLAQQVRDGSLCGLGRTAPNPVLTTLHYFRDEYEAHIKGRCPAGRCRELIHYRITERCVGCTLCAQHCPAGAIAPRPYARHEIIDPFCTRCDACRSVCPYEAVVVE